jgi:catechol 2,3-dioxygenase-like lactoylglutathione lyase family enzyme
MGATQPASGPAGTPADTRFGARRLDHVAVVVTDVGRARRFYADVLRLPEVPRPESFDFPGTWFQIGPHELGQTLHLLGRPETEGLGRRHFCLWVDDVHATARHVRASGCEVIWEYGYKINGVDRFFTSDPDGNRIEVQGPEAR